MKSVDTGENVNEVEAAGNTPLHHAAYEGWLQGAELLLSLGAHINASNNAGDRPWHWARNMGYADMMEMLEQVRRVQCITTPEYIIIIIIINNTIIIAIICSANSVFTCRMVPQLSKVLVADHIPKVKV